MTLAVICTASALFWSLAGHFRATHYMVTTHFLVSLYTKATSGRTKSVFYADPAEMLYHGKVPSPVNRCHMHGKNRVPETRSESTTNNLQSSLYW